MTHFGITSIRYAQNRKIGNQIHVIQIKEEQTTNGQKEKLQKDKQQSTKHTHKTKDRVTQS